MNIKTLKEVDSNRVVPFYKIKQGWGFSIHWSEESFQEYINTHFIKVTDKLAKPGNMLGSKLINTKIEPSTLVKIVPYYPWYNTNEDK